MNAAGNEGVDAAAIDLLCKRIGLALGYWDVSGIWRAPSLADRAALLEGLGWPAGDPAALARALARLDAEDRRVLPPVRVVVENTQETVRIVLPPGEGPGYEIRLEDGSVLTGPVPDAMPPDAILADPAARLLVLPKLPVGYHRFSLPGRDDAAMPLVVVPAQCFLPPALDGGGRVWGLAVQLYSVRSRGNWGIGDYSDLAALARLAGAAGADVIGVNPLHARSLIRPAECSPYAPTSRLALDTLAIDVEALPELALSAEAQALIASADFQTRLAELRALPMVDHPGVAALKLQALRLLHAAFLTAPAERKAAYDAFVVAGGEAIRRYAQFEALRAYHDVRTGPSSWHDWPAEPTPDDPVLADEVQFELWLQFVADEQLHAAAAAARESGMRIGIYRDLAVGAAGDSAEAWSAPELAARVTIGAPPDAMSLHGQNWGMPAPDPRALAAAGYASFGALLRANMRHAGALRIDHAMALARLFVIPPGKTGAAGSYLAYPFEAMAGVLALESRRHGCVVIGEDLGTVPEGFRSAMAARNVLSYKVLAFERYDDGAFKTPADYPWLALATAATHDLPPLAGHWLGADIALRATLGLEEDRAASEADRLRERQRLLTLFDWQGVTPSPRPDPADPAPRTDEVVAATHLLISRTASAIAMVQLDDILGETAPVNIPGTSTEYPNWRRKSSLALEDEELGRRFAAAASLFVKPGS